MREMKGCWLSFWLFFFFFSYFPFGLLCFCCYSSALASVYGVIWLLRLCLSLFSCFLFLFFSASAAYNSSLFFFPDLRLGHAFPSISPFTLSSLSLFWDPNLFMSCFTRGLYRCQSDHSLLLLIWRALSLSCLFSLFFFVLELAFSLVLSVWTVDALVMCFLSSVDFNHTNIVCNALFAFAACWTSIWCGWSRDGKERRETGRRRLQGHPCLETFPASQDITVWLSPSPSLRSNCFRLCIRVCLMLEFAFSSHFYPRAGEVSKGLSSSSSSTRLVSTGDYEWWSFSKSGFIKHVALFLFQFYEYLFDSNHYTTIYDMGVSVVSQWLSSKVNSVKSCPRFARRTYSIGIIFMMMLASPQRASPDAIGGIDGHSSCAIYCTFQVLYAHYKHTHVESPLISYYVQTHPELESVHTQRCAPSPNDRRLGTIYHSA